MGGDTRADRGRGFIKKGGPGKEQQGGGNPRIVSAYGLQFGFSGDGIRFRLSLASHSDEVSFLVVPTCVA